MSSAETVAAQLKDLENQKKIVNNRINELKIQLKYKDLTDQIKGLKEELYYLMEEQELDSVGGYSIEKLLPAEEKKKIREEKKKELYQQTLSNEIRNEKKLNTLIDQLVSIKV